MKILVTGAAGFIGGNLTRSLRDGGFDVLGIDNFSEYYNPSMKTERVHQSNLSQVITKLDICDRKKLERLFRRFNPTHVVHLAAQGGVRASKSDPQPYLSSNQIGFLNVLQISEELNVEKFIYASSSSVYGDDLQAPFKESDLLNSPKSLYALSKLSNELIAKYLPAKNTQRIGLRFFTVYGPWGRPDMAVFRLLASSLLGDSFKLTASLEVKRDFTFVDDVSKVVHELINSKERMEGSQIFNVAGGNPYSLSELLTIMKSFDINVKYDSHSEDDLDLKLTHGSTDKLRSKGLSIPNTSLNVGIDKTWTWLKTQQPHTIREWLDYE